MAERRHSSVQFNTTEWLADTARMPRLVRAVLHDLCCYTWERAAAVPMSEQFLMLSDLPEGQGDAILKNLVAGGHLVLNADGSVYAPKAMGEAARSLALYEAKSRGGRGRAPAPLEPPAAPSKPERDLHEERMDAYQFGTVPERTPTLAPVSDAEIAAAWNKMAAKNGYKQISKMTSERLGRLHERIAEHGADALVKVIEYMPEAVKRVAQALGREAPKPVFDDLLKPSLCAKLIAEACGEAAGKAGGEEPA